ncbi:hypothetical protein KY290_026162 [Solanum tuberosum]|uniref:Ulp1 protease family, C-terminal catalytic domain containing protein n=1 Tax=Solanum tuberosum TaxID=4113 RepID=A0ABQ7UVN8_SOLTU|nr:hypothetical protein KY289_025977 [Solanum tuberosum]KAH0673919.1 hypothetical protein KY284_025006 [Solanum tuberosum]KAH0755892.1 hypothetical protein KY290_026162 [Solanum tuberosum]
MNSIDHNNLHESSSHHETENQAISERNDVDLDEKYVELKNEIAEVRQELKELKDNVYKHMIELKAYVDNSTKLIIDEIRSSIGQPTQTSHQEDDVHQHVEETEKARMDQPSVSMREYVDISNTEAEEQNSIDQTVGGVSNADLLGSSASKPPSLDDYPDLTMTQIFQLEPILNVTTTPDVQPRNRNPTSESSVRRGPIFSRIKHAFESHNRFEVTNDLIDEFNKWVFKDVSSKRGSWHEIDITKDVARWEYQLKPNSFSVEMFPHVPFFPMKPKYSPQPLSYSTVDCWFMSWVDNIEKQWRDSNYDMRSISPDHDIGQCFRGYKLLANIPWDRVDDVIIPLNA